MDSILTQLVSYIMLPLFLIMILCMIAGAKPEPVIRGLFGLAEMVLKLLLTIVTGIFRILGDAISKSRKRKTQPQNRRGSSRTSG